MRVHVRSGLGEERARCGLGEVRTAGQLSRAFKRAAAISNIIIHVVRVGVADDRVATNTSVGR